MTFNNNVHNTCVNNLITNTLLYTCVAKNGREVEHNSSHDVFRCQNVKNKTPLSCALLSVIPLYDMGGGGGDEVPVIV